MMDRLQELLALLTGLVSVVVGAVAWWRRVRGKTTTVTAPVPTVPSSVKDAAQEVERGLLNQEAQRYRERAQQQETKLQDVDRQMQLELARRRSIGDDQSYAEDYNRRHDLDRLPNGKPKA